MFYSVVLDTNVLVSALRSKKGASYKLFMLIGRGLFDINISVPVGDNRLQHDVTIK